uniref:Uncharacterized protein n=1 Tax=Ciona savignyi TaxID=51511 RepID=H2YBB3_CIOSA
MVLQSLWPLAFQIQGQCWVLCTGPCFYINLQISSNSFQIISTIHHAQRVGEIMTNKIQVSES